MYFCCIDGLKPHGNVEGLFFFLKKKTLSVNASLRHWHHK